jgi:hypothetical protein
VTGQKLSENSKFGEAGKTLVPILDMRNIGMIFRQRIFIASEGERQGIGCERLRAFRNYRKSSQTA